MLRSLCWLAERWWPAGAAAAYRETYALAADGWNATLVALRRNDGAHLFQIGKIPENRFA